MSWFRTGTPEFSALTETLPNHMLLSLFPFLLGRMNLRIGGIKGEAHGL